MSAEFMIKFELNFCEMILFKSFASYIRILILIKQKQLRGGNISTESVMSRDIFLLLF